LYCIEYHLSKKENMSKTYFILLLVLIFPLQFSIIHIFSRWNS